MTLEIWNDGGGGCMASASAFIALSHADRYLDSRIEDGVIGPDDHNRLIDRDRGFDQKNAVPEGLY